MIEWGALTRQQQADYVQGLYIALRNTQLEGRTVLTTAKRIGLVDGRAVLADAGSFVQLELRGWLVDSKDVAYIWSWCRGKPQSAEMVELFFLLGRERDDGVTNVTP